MAKPSTRSPLDLRRSGVAVAHLEEMLDAVVTAAALVARADGWVQGIERAQLLDFLDRSDLLSVFTRAEASEAFARRVQELREPGGTAAALERLGRQAGGKAAEVLIEASEEIAAADCRIDPRERHLLQLMRSVLGARSRTGVARTRSIEGPR